jgi:predicted SAM-dependent methyltransferase
MGRVLSISRVRVSPEHEAEYLRTVRRLADLARDRAQHLWLFRNPEVPGSFIEFSESSTEPGHRVRSSRTDLEARLERRLQEIAEYAPDAWELWAEVPDRGPDARLDS